VPALGLFVHLVFRCWAHRLLTSSNRHSKHTPGLLHDFDDFYDMEEIGRYVDVIQMSEFLEREGLMGRLKEGELPPGNATKFDRKRPLWEYIRRATDVFPVGPSHVVGFEYDLGEGFDAASLDFADHRPLFVYGPELHAKRSLHFTSMMDGGQRYLVHFYAFLYFRDPAADRFLKRFVRDVLHYEPSIYCHAQKVVDLLHADSGGTRECEYVAGWDGWIEWG